MKIRKWKNFCRRYFTFDLDTFLEDVFTTFLWPAPEKKSENESSISICWMDLLTRQIFSFGTRMNISIMATGLAVVICFHGKNSRGKIFRYNRHFKYYLKTPAFILNILKVCQTHELIILEIMTYD